MINTPRLIFTAGPESLAAPNMARYVSVRLCPETIFRRTLWVIAALVGASLFAAFMSIELGHGRLWGLSNLVHLDQERNLPTLFSSLQLLFAGSIAWFLGAKEHAASLRWLWRFLGVGLCFMALDESVSIHEMSSDLDVGAWRDATVFRYAAWVVPGIAVAMFCGAILLKLLLALPRRTAAMLFLSGAVFLTGAIVVELLGMPYYKVLGSEDWTYTMWYTLEETLEMLGPALFIRTALRYGSMKQNEAAQSVRVTLPLGQR